TWRADRPADVPANGTSGHPCRAVRRVIPTDSSPDPFKQVGFRLPPAVGGAEHAVERLRPPECLVEFWRQLAQLLVLPDLGLMTRDRAPHRQPVVSGVD